MIASTKILAVDDEPDFEFLIRQRFRRQIREEEFAFRFAHHGEEALSALDAEPDIDLMLLDINMPVMDGLTLLSELRERQSAVRAIIVSAYGDMTNLRTAMNRGAFDFVTKPVDLSDLEITVRKALANIAKLREMDRLRQAAERARNNLSRYFSPNIVELLAAQDEPLGTVRRETVAVLFADIVGFTRMAETMPPEAVMAMLREFHARMTAQIFACGGTVDKYIGDAIVAVFGVPTRAPMTPPTRSPAPERCSMRSRAGMTSASARERAGSLWASASTTGRPFSAMSAASTACRSPSSAIPSTPRPDCRR